MAVTVIWGRLSWFLDLSVLIITASITVSAVDTKHHEKQGRNWDVSRALGNNVGFVGNAFPARLALARLALLAFKELGRTCTLWCGLLVVWEQKQFSLVSLVWIKPCSLCSDQCHESGQVIGLLGGLREERETLLSEAALDSSKWRYCLKLPLTAQNDATVWSCPWQLKMTLLSEAALGSSKWRYSLKLPLTAQNDATVCSCLHLSYWYQLKQISS